MKISEMIAQLNVLRDELGDVEVLVTDGYNAACYRGSYDIVKWIEDDGSVVVDIGIGGCMEEFV
jgi:hypothetical protein